MTTYEMSIEEFRVMKQRPKYGNTRVVVDGHTFDSQAEAERYKELKLTQTAGQITGLTCQPPFELQAGFRDHAGVKHRAITYRADFRYTEVATGAQVVEDVKGMRTKEFSIKEKLFRFRYSELDLRIIEVTR